MSKKMTRRHLVAKAEVKNEKEGLVKYVASDETLDADGDIVLVDGWDFSRFQKNAPFLNNHRQMSIEDMLGKVVSADVIDGQLVQKVEWAVGVDHKLADIGFAMTKAGFLKGVSAGFIPLEMITRQGTPDFDQRAQELGVKNYENANCIYIKQQQIELSAVLVGSNPNALIKSYEEGVLGEGDLAELGFNDDDKRDFLAKTATAMEDPALDDLMKSIITVQLKQIFGERKLATTKQKTTTSPTSGTPSGEVMAKRMARRKSFINQLESLTS